MAHVSALDRRAQLVSAAIDLMARDGMAAGSTRAIAAELGVAQAIVHYVFGTKQELQRAILTEITGSILGQVEGTPVPTDDFAGSLNAWARALWQTVERQRDRYALLFEFTASALRDSQLRSLLAAHDRNIEVLASNLIAGASARAHAALARPAGDLARFFLTGFDGIVVRYLTDGDGGAARALLQDQVSATIALAAPAARHKRASRSR